jgi:hypothetical protein
MLEVLTQESVDKLRDLAKHGEDLRESSFESLCETHQLRLTGSDYLIVEKYQQLTMPEGIAQAENSDTENCIQIGKFLPDLTAAQATDERLWVTLCLNQFREYAIARWPDQRNFPREKNIPTHWFAAGLRPRMRDNAIGRLWWYQYFCKKVPGQNLEEVFTVLFENSDYRSTILERSSSASFVNVTTAILDITKEAYSKEISYNRDKFRNFIKRVNFLAARTKLGALDADQIKNLLSPLYDEAYR